MASSEDSPVTGTTPKNEARPEDVDPNSLGAENGPVTKWMIHSKRECLVAFILGFILGKDPALLAVLA